MSHSEEPAICPNCGYVAGNNYCAQCGQKNHLHKDTTWSLIMHFLEHYLHYDNKFWQTMRALLFKPGKLTIAYWNNQRQRFISPVSLYIFISAVQFLVAHYVWATQEKKVFDTIKGNGVVVNTDNIRNAPAVEAKPGNLELVMLRIQKNPEILRPYIDDIEHDTPKLFFFMIPFTALLLKLFFLKRKEIYFVDHVIFSLHFHSFYFMISIICTLTRVIPILGIFTGFAAFILYFVYFERAIKNTYHVKTGTAIGSTFFVGFIYAMAYSVISLLYLWYVLKGLLVQ